MSGFLLRLNKSGLFFEQVSKIISDQNSFSKILMNISSVYLIIYLGSFTKFISNYTNVDSKKINIHSRNRGFHIITDDVLKYIPELKDFKIGILHLFIKHTSASLTINEHSDPTVRTDFESHFNILVPENQTYYSHTIEGADDMPAHLKSSLLGSSVSIPIKDGKLNLGTWQGIYLCEHRNHASNRELIVTIQGSS